VTLHGEDREQADEADSLRDQGDREDRAAAAECPAEEVGAAPEERRTERQTDADQSLGPRARAMPET
jgi:hypothetical protein